MSELERIDPLPSLLPAKLISFVGGGGKTSLAEYLGREAGRRGKRAVMTTTTRILATRPYILLDDGGLAEEASAGRFVRVGRSREGEKLTPLGDDDLSMLCGMYDFVLVEADGAKRLPLKYPASYEPVISRLSGLTVVVAGLDALGATVGEKIFRWRLFAEAAGVSPAEKITVPIFSRLFEEDGLMKGVDRAKSVVVLNKYDACGRPDVVPDLARAVLKRTGSRQVIVASVRRGVFYGLSSASSPPEGG